MFGIKIFISVIVVLLQDKSSIINVPVQLQRLFGLVLIVNVHQIHLDPTVLHAPLLDSGMEIIVFVQKIEFGMVKIVFVPQVFMVQIVFHVPALDSGIKHLNNVFVQKTEFGMVKIVYVHQASMVLTANHAHSQENG